MGIIGFGRIGQQVADIAAVFGMSILAYNLYKEDHSQRKGFKWAELDELLGNSDVVRHELMLLAIIQLNIIIIV